jgi:hypothetical protein
VPLALGGFLQAFHFLLSGVLVSLVWSSKKLRILWRHFLVGLCVILFVIESSHNRVVHPFGDALLLSMLGLMC